MAKEDLVDAVASAVVAHLLATKTDALCGVPVIPHRPHHASSGVASPGGRGMAPWPGDDHETGELIASIDGLSDSDIEAIAAELADELAPLLEREELPADNVEI
jgi:hypothetical protein